MLGEKSERFHFNGEELQFPLEDMTGDDFWDHIKLDLLRQKEQNPNI